MKQTGEIVLPTLQSEALPGEEPVTKEKQV